jgi:hypothetical protein
MGGEPVQQQIGHPVGLLVEDPMRDALEDLESVVAEHIVAGETSTLLP